MKIGIAGMGYVGLPRAVASLHAAESPAVTIMRLLREQGAELSYFDEYVAELPELALRSEWPDDADCTVIVTAHPDLDVERILPGPVLVVDFRGVIRGFEAPNVVRL